MTAPAIKSVPTDAMTSALDDLPVESHRNARGRWVSEGRRRFGEAAAGQQEKVAARLGISQPAVSQLVSGRARPGLDLAVRIEAAYGIHCSEWVVAPNTNISAACLKSDDDAARVA